MQAKQFHINNFKKLINTKCSVEYIPETSSTIDIATTIDASAVPTFIITDKQTNGRGRRGNQWIDCSQAQLLASIVINIQDSINSQLQYIVAILSLCQALKLLNRKTFLKWPNDIIFQEKKVAGILIENFISATTTLNSSKTIISLGVNCYPSSSGPHIGLTKEAVLACFYKQYTKNVALLKTSNDTNILSIFNTYDFLINKNIQCVDKITGKIYHSGKYLGLDTNSLTPKILTQNGTVLANIDWQIKFTTNQ